MSEAKITSSFDDGSQTAVIKISNHIDEQEFRFAIDFREDFNVVRMAVSHAYQVGKETVKR